MGQTVKLPNSVQRGATARSGVNLGPGKPWLDSADPGGCLDEQYLRLQMINKYKL